ncbi:MAG: TRAP transporter small permease [Oscillospiraceae bacterium]
MAVCFVMVFVVSIDVILRKVSGQTISIKGSNEFSAYFLIVIVMLSIPALQVKKGHVWVNMFVNMFPTRFRSFWLGCITALETVVAAGLTYGSIRQMLALISNGRATDVLNMPWWPFAAVCAFGFLEFTVLLLIDTIQFFIDGARGGEKKLAADAE